MLLLFATKIKINKPNAITAVKTNDKIDNGKEIIAEFIPRSSSSEKLIYLKEPLSNSFSI